MKIRLTEELTRHVIVEVPDELVEDPEEYYGENLETSEIRDIIYGHLADNDWDWVTIHESSFTRERD